jgi:orotate phosphoribosyltransferase
VGLMVAQELDLPFAYSEPRAAGDASGLFPVRYRIPEAQRSALRERRVAVVNDVVNAGSAVRGTLEALRACGAEPIALATLVALGPAARGLAEENHLAFETLCELPNTIWRPDECPLCVRGIALSEGTPFK